MGRTPEGTAVMLPNSGVMLCKKESQVKSKKMAFSHEKVKEKSQKTDFSFDFSWLKAIFFDFTWLSFLQSVMCDWEPVVTERKS